MRVSLLTQRRALASARDTYLRLSRASAPFICSSYPTPSATAAARARPLKPRQQTRPFSSTHSAVSPSSAAATEPADSSGEQPSHSQQRPSSSEQQTHYGLFPQTFPHGPPPASPFAPNLALLKREFLSLQARTHPDLVPASQKAKAQALSARLNEAYKTLSSPLLRAQYLLALQGRADRSSSEAAKTDDPELLLEVLETHHAIEEAQTEEVLEGIRHENEARIRESEGRIAGMIERGEWEMVAEETVRMKYWVSVGEKIHEWEVGHGKTKGEGE